MKTEDLIIGDVIFFPDTNFIFEIMKLEGDEFEVKSNIPFIESLERNILQKIRVENLRSSFRNSYFKVFRNKNEVFENFSAIQKRIKVECLKFSSKEEIVSDFSNGIITY